MGCLVSGVSWRAQRRRRHPRILSWKKFFLLSKDYLEGLGEMEIVSGSKEGEGSSLSVRERVHYEQATNFKAVVLSRSEAWINSNKVYARRMIQDSLFRVRKEVLP